MELNDIKIYLATRINTSEILSESDEVLVQYLTTAERILNTFYYIEQISDEKDLIAVVAEEMLFLYNSNIDLNLFYQYEGLTSFNIGKGSVQGSVDYKNKGDLLSAMVKAMLASLGIEEKIEIPDSKVKNGFTWL